MAAHRTLTAFVRHSLGIAAHRAGAATRADVRTLRAELHALRDELGAPIGALEHRVESIERAHREATARLEVLEPLAQIDAVSRLIRRGTLRTEPLVSVVLPTRDRPERLRRAIASVLAQRYERWELLVVDDGGTRDSREVVREAADERILWTRIDKRGACAARNAALETATGSLVAYLDDDNLMDPEWLYSLVWAFEQRPDVEVVYGAFVIDDPLRVDGSSSGALPRTVLNSWSREALRDHNLADVGAIAHRGGLPAARFDDHLREFGDWDLLIGLTAERDPLMLPVVACYYTTDAPNRLTAGPTHAIDHAVVTARAAARDNSGAEPLAPEALAGRRVPSMPLTRRPTVSVVIPCHNYGSFLAAAVVSVTTQMAVEVDVLIIDDCSTDSSKRLAEALAEADPRITAIIHKRNLGHIATYNEGIARAEGDYVVLLSADDLLTPGSLARATALLDAHPSVGFAYGDVVTFQGESVPPARQTADSWRIWEGRDWIAERCRVGGNVVFSPEVVIRTSLQREIGEYRVELPHTGDMEMWLRAAAVAEVGRVEGADQAFYRVHSDSLSHALCPAPIDDLRARHDAFASVLSTRSAIRGADGLYRQACSALAAAAMREALDTDRTLTTGEVDELAAFALELSRGTKETAAWQQLELRRSTTTAAPSGPIGG